jgi:hypothetical protein
VQATIHGAATSPAILGRAFAGKIVSIHPWISGLRPALCATKSAILLICVHWTIFFFLLTPAAGLRLNDPEKY